jgi:hypothetical protein
MVARLVRELFDREGWVWDGFRTIAESDGFVGLECPEAAQGELGRPDGDRRSLDGR